MSPTRVGDRIRISELEGHLGRLAVERGLLTLEQFLECLTLRNAEDPAAPLEIVLVSNGYLSEQQAEELAQAATDAAQAPPAPVPARRPAAPRVPVGRGPSGSVYRTFLPDHAEPVAAKEISANALNRPFLAAFAENARRAAALVHPGVARILGVEERHDALVIYSEFVRGATLREYLDRHGPLPLEKAAGILRQVAGVLHVAHAKEILHANLKAENVFLCSGGRVRLTDFGLARAEPAWLRPHADKAGTIVYSLAPEQWTHGAIPASDLYQSGVLWHLLLTGRPPFEAKSFEEIRRKHEREEPRPPSGINPGLVWGADAIFSKLLQKAPSDRYPSAREFQEDLERLLRGEPVRAGQAERARRGRIERRSRA
jgi:serine/threonine-protein kinase